LDIDSGAKGTVISISLPRHSKPVSEAVA